MLTISSGVEGKIIRSQRIWPILKSGCQDEESEEPIDLEKIFADDDGDDEEEDFHGLVDAQLVTEIMTVTSTLLKRVTEPEKPSRILFPSTPTQVWRAESQFTSTSESVSRWTERRLGPWNGICFRPW